MTLGKANFILTSYALMRLLLLTGNADAGSKLLAELLSELIRLLTRLLGLGIGLAGGLIDGILIFLPIPFARFLARFPNGLLVLAGIAAAAAAAVGFLAGLVEELDELPEEIMFLVAATLCLSKSILPLC